MKSLKVFKIAGLGVLVLGVIGAVAHFSGNGRKPGQDKDIHLIGLAVSDSDAAGCAAVIGIATEIVKVHKPSRTLVLELYRSGDAASADEPVSLGERITVEPSKKMSEAGSGPAKEGLQKAIDQVRAQCSSVQVTQVSPIYLMVQTLSAGLRRRGCGEDGVVCHLWVASDLEETEEKGLKDRIRGGKDHDLPPKIENEGSAVTLCGFAQTLGLTRSASGRAEWKTQRRRADRDENLQAAWKAVFEDQAAVEIRPFCPRVE